MRSRAFIPRVPGVAQHERSEVMRCRPGTVTSSEYGTVPDQRCTTRAAHSRCAASGTRGIGRRTFITLISSAAAAAWPPAARAQQPKMLRLGFVGIQPRDAPIYTNFLRRMAHPKRKITPESIYAKAIRKRLI